MSERDSNANLLFHEAHVNEIILELGGVKALREGKDEFHQAVLHMDKEYTALMEKYPNQWVAVGKDGVLAVRDSMEEVFAAVESADLRGSEFVVEFLDTDPPDLIL
jgi:hypothetical protein